MMVREEAPARMDRPVSMLRVFAELKADGFPEKGDLRPLGRMSPQTRIEAVFNNGAKYVFLLGNKNDMNLDHVMKEESDPVCVKEVNCIDTPEWTLSAKDLKRLSEDKRRADPSEAYFQLLCDAKDR
jgi:hypothetical protein